MQNMLLFHVVRGERIESAHKITLLDAHGKQAVAPASCRRWPLFTAPMNLPPARCNQLVECITTGVRESKMAIQALKIVAATLALTLVAIVSALVIPAGALPAFY
jgi:hypothetical protein